MESMSVTPDAVLASDSDIMALLAGLAAPRTRRSSKDRNDQQLARSVITAILPALAPSSYLGAKQSATIPATADSHEPPVGVESAASGKPVSRIRQRQYCKCGACKWCLDNARWDRIFNEKFVDPTYYRTHPVRHSSSLAGAR